MYEIILTLLSIGIAGFVFFGEEKRFLSFYVKKVFIPCLFAFSVMICEMIFVNTSFLRENLTLSFSPYYLLGLYWCILGYKNIIVEIKEKFGN